MSSHDHFDVVLFDLGGIVIELGGMRDIVVFSGETDEAEIWRRWLHCPWVQRFERGDCDEHAFARGMVETWSMPVGPEEFLAAFETWPKGLLPGAIDLVNEIGAKTRVAALSNTNAVHDRRFRDAFRLHEHFEALYLSHEIGLVKPHREAFDYAVDALGCPRERILFLDDNQINVDAAREAGLHAELAVRVDGARSALAARGFL